jgi:hypothetical protein
MPAWSQKLIFGNDCYWRKAVTKQSADIRQARAREARPNPASTALSLSARLLNTLCPPTRTARVLGQHHCLRRGTSAPDSKIIRRLIKTPSERIGLCTRMRRFPVRFIRPEPFVHTRSGHIGLWTKMRRSAGQFSGPESSLQIRSLADFITATSESRFSVPTVTTCRAHLRYRRNATTPLRQSHCNTLGAY